MANPALSLVHGPTTTPLWTGTLGSLIKEQNSKHGNKTAIIVPWQGRRLTYYELDARSEAVASSLLSLGIRPGNAIAIMAGNRFEYIEAFLAAGRIGCPVIVLNNTYTPSELISALTRTSTRLLFIAAKIGTRDMSEHADSVIRQAASDSSAATRHVVLWGENSTYSSVMAQSYQQFLNRRSEASAFHLQRAEANVKPDDLLNVQFTSGTTGNPKGAMLSHINIINNAQFVGSRMRLTSLDIVCCPPPLFHCFGLVMGFLNSFFHGGSIVFPSDSYDANAVLDAIANEGCTGLLGVPTMFLAQLDVLKSKPSTMENKTLRVGLAAGSMVSPQLLKRLDAEMGLQRVLVAYGMTETSPVSFMIDHDDPPRRRQRGLGKVMPHTSAKVVDAQGRIVPIGSRGEMCVSGYALMKGYLDNPKATGEVMVHDDQGVTWMRTGDECAIDEEGYCEITGRIKDLIIRGGENIFPGEIEERLLEHPGIIESSVVGISDEKYGEVVACFLRATSSGVRVAHHEVQEWVRMKLGRHKAPNWVFWIGDPAVGDDFPKTGSGKHQKHILRAIGERLRQMNEKPRPRL
ncbi:hypothetical protein PFICI_11098 [Pestalotiopsis fici W106-1]|uniref:Uncharacterized protein n=1 Tax=Pestalotiopsis fici (strain W106-1 / CGMCC3.15140) TaxID=1229662 RepID=W3WTW2_PESFW|nr:uncharacterized protein PFICI_11098 [Pestalotiopsis fici W106-1]ETS77224.1 hypothetical protein PFICI_11098 [Pestalotiopsis fici W106-1]